MFPSLKHCLGALRADLVRAGNVRDGVPGGAKFTHRDARRQLVRNQPGGLFGTCQRSVVERSERDIGQTSAQQLRLAGAAIGESGIPVARLSVASEVQMTGPKHEAIPSRLRPMARSTT